MMGMNKHVHYDPIYRSNSPINEGMIMISKIKDAFKALARHDREIGGLSSKRWSGRVFSALGKIGQGSGYRVYAQGNPPNTHGPSFLYDLCWLKYDQHTCLKRCGLILECEWGNARQIDDDFQKLLIGRADLKVMVFQRRTDARVKELFTEMARWIDRFDQAIPGENHLMCGWSFESRDFQFHVRR